MTIFDRYLLRRYWHVFGVGYLALFGLYFVIDVFTNVNDFLDQAGGPLAILLDMGRFYAYRACYFFGLVGGTLEVIAAMVALALTQKHGELNPVLSAGVSTFRLMQPLLIGAALVNGLILLNQEWLTPRIAMQLQMDVGHRSDVAPNPEPVTDFATDILIAGKRLNLREQKLEEAEFFVKSPVIIERPRSILAVEAVPVAPRGNRPGGWLLKGTSSRYESLPLTDAGRKIVRRGPSGKPDEIFVRTDVGFDRLYNRDKHYEYLSTWELLRRIRNPSFNQRSVRNLSLYLHTRFTKPVLNLIVVLVGVPFVVRRESVSLITNLAICSGMMGLMLAVNELCLYLGKVNLISPELAVWSPIVIWGSTAAWLTGLVRT
ncbi:MAG: LptF/LptG family permease [Planctomycetaceae bacterium]